MLKVLQLGGKPFYRDGDQSLSIKTCQSCVYIFQYPHVESHTFDFSTEVKALTPRPPLSMAEFSTPSQEKNTLSSVFMTPSSSCGRPVFHPAKSLFTPLQFSLPATPLPSTSPTPPAREEYKDIITGLFEAGIPLVAKRVLSELDHGDLTKCLQVSKSWRTHISLWHPLPPRPTTPQEVDSLTDENSTNISVHKSQSLRAPLATINNAPQRQDSPRKSKRALTHCSLKMRPCPKCQSPAKRLNMRRSECTKCLYDFCEHCFSSWHEESCGGKDMLTSPKKTQVSVAGTKKSKRRLKRL